MIQVTEIEMYQITQRFLTAQGFVIFAGQIFASSLGEAEQMARTIGADLAVNGFETCDGCGHTTPSEQSIQDIWADEIN